MCCVTETEARPGLIDRARAWFAGPAEPGPYRPTAEDVDAFRRRQRADAIAAGKELCRRCGAMIGDSPGETCGLLDRAACYSCDATWLEDAVLWPLVDRLGRRGARRALRRLVREVQRLV